MLPTNAVSLTGAYTAQGDRLIVQLPGGISAEFQVVRNSFDATTHPRGVVWVYCHQSAQNGIQEWYAFISQVERELFLKFLEIDGVGPKSAMSILDKNGTTHILELITRRDQEGIRKLRGVGPKMFPKAVDALLKEEPKPEVITKAPKPEVDEDAIAGLMTMGYKKADARDLVAKVMGAEKGLDTATIIVKVLKGGRK